MNDTWLKYHLEIAKLETQILQRQERLATIQREAAELRTLISNDRTRADTLREKLEVTT